MGAPNPEPPTWLVGVAFRGRPWGMGVAEKTPKVCANGPAPAQGSQICVPKRARLWVSTRELGRALGGLVLIPGKPLPGVFSPWEGAGGAPPGEIPAGVAFPWETSRLCGVFSLPTPVMGTPLGVGAAGARGEPRAGRQRAEVSIFSFFFFLFPS